MQILSDSQVIKVLNKIQACGILYRIENDYSGNTLVSLIKNSFRVDSDSQKISYQAVRDWKWRYSNAVDINEAVSILASSLATYRINIEFAEWYANLIKEKNEKEDTQYRKQLLQHEEQIQNLKKYVIGALTRILQKDNTEPNEKLNDTQRQTLLEIMQRFDSPTPAIKKKGKIHIFEKEQLGELFDKLYESEIHSTFYWIWDLGFDFRIGATDNVDEIVYARDQDAVTEHLLMMNYKELPVDVKLDIKEADINYHKVEEVASALAYALYKWGGHSYFVRWYRSATGIHFKSAQGPEVDQQLFLNHDDVSNAEGVQSTNGCLDFEIEFRELQKEYRHLLTKLSEMAFVLGDDPKYIMEEAAKERTELEALEAESFVKGIARKFETKSGIDHQLIAQIKSWEIYYTEHIAGSINRWISVYIKNNLETSRLEEIEQFICKQEIEWLKSLADYDLY